MARVDAARRVHERRAPPRAWLQRRRRRLEVARDFLLHLSRLYPALQVVECANALSLATAHVQRVEARVEVKIATAREPRGAAPSCTALVPTWSFPAAAVLQLGRAPPLRALEVGTVPTWTKAPNVAGRSLQDFAKTSPRLESFRCLWLAADAHLVAVAQSWPHLASLALPGCASLTGGARRRSAPAPLEFIEVASALERKPSQTSSRRARPPARPPARARPSRAAGSLLRRSRRCVAVSVMRHDSKKLHIKVEAMGDEIIHMQGGDGDAQTDERLLPTPGVPRCPPASGTTSSASRTTTRRAPSGSTTETSSTSA